MRIACLLDHDFEDSEFRVPYNAFQSAGHEVVVIGLKRDSKLTGKEGREAAGANVLDTEVVIDRNLVTSRQPEDLDVFAMASIDMLNQVGAAVR